MTDGTPPLILDGAPRYLSLLPVEAVSFTSGRELDHTGAQLVMGATPLDPQAAVERWKPALKADHRNKLILLILLANFVWVFGVGNVLVDGAHWAGIPKHHDVWAYFLQDLSTLIIIPAYWLIQRVHRDLYPWCPWCHWDDGGDEEKVPDPDPEDHGVKPPVLS